MAETGPRNQVVEFYTIEGTNEIVRAGDSVLLELLEADHSTTRTTVVRVEQLETHYNGNAAVKVRHYYTPEDVVRGRRNIFGAKELFLSDQYDVRSARTIREKVNVHSLDDYERRLAVHDEDYYCRFEYQVSSGSFTPEYVEVFHDRCIGMTVEQGMTDEQANQLNHYLCGDCLHVDDAESVASADADDSLSTWTAQGIARTQNTARAPTIDPSLPITSVEVHPRVRQQSYFPHCKAGLVERVLLSVQLRRERMAERIR